MALTIAEFQQLMQKRPWKGGNHVAIISPTPKKKAKLPKAGSHLEATFDLQVKAERLPVPEQEYKFHLGRDWRFDFAWPDKMLAVEVEGGTRNNGRHNRHDGYQKDCEKYNSAQLLGWRVLRYTGEMVKSGVAIDQVSKAIRS